MTTDAGALWARTQCDMLKCRWKEVYYGHECTVCGEFVAHGCEPWLPFDDDDDDFEDYGYYPDGFDAAWLDDEHGNLSDDWPSMPDGLDGIDRFLDECGPATGAESP